MKIAYYGHSHHRTTRSTAFLQDALRTRGEVQEFWYDGWLTGAAFDPTPVLERHFDAVVVFQVESAAHVLAQSGLPNVTFFPMYDGCHGLLDSYWRALAGIKVVSFSSTLHERLQRLGVRSRFVRYFPDPGNFGRAGANELAGYFWQRQQDITWATLRPVIGETHFKRFTLHKAIDPSFGSFVEPSEQDVRRHGIRITDWFPSRQGAVADLLQHNVYFAPRLREGIGMSFLEAMAMGFLVVAPDQPTMSEYIVPGVNGLLYDPRDPRPLDFSRYEELGTRARQSVEAGWRKWRRCEPSLLDFVCTPAAEVPLRAPIDAFDPLATETPARAPNRAREATAQGAQPLQAAQSPRFEGGNRLRHGRRADDVVAPLVTVAVVTRNAEAVLASTLDSILSQDWPRLEVVVLDGASTDGTLEILRRYEEALDYWKSEPDEGPYEAMNEAATVAAGRYVIFMNAGDRFQTTDAISMALEGAPAEADVIFGHHVYRDVRGYDDLHPAADFRSTWSQLRDGEIGWRWLSRVPGHQATLTRTELLRRSPYRTELRIAADHEFLYRTAKNGGRLHHSLAIIATYASGGLSWNQQGRCFDEWRKIALEYSERPDAVARTFDAMWKDMAGSELPELSMGRLILSVGRTRGATRELKRRLRTKLAAIRERHGRLEPAVLVHFGEPDLGGLSHAEEWGRWTEGAHALIELRNTVKNPVRLAIEIRDVVGTSVGKPLLVRIGTHAYRHVLRRGAQRFSAALHDLDGAGLQRIELEIPAPMSPKEAGTGEDPRRLGVALSVLEISCLREGRSRRHRSG